MIPFVIFFPFSNEMDNLSIMIPSFSSENDCLSIQLVRKLWYHNLPVHELELNLLRVLSIDVFQVGFVAKGIESETSFSDINLTEKVGIE